MDTEHLKQVLTQFRLDSHEVVFRTIDTGYINDTFLVLKSNKPLYILQRINPKIFKNIEQLMLNIEKVLDNLKSDDYSTISLLKTIDGQSFYKDNNSYWRITTFIKGSQVYNTTTNPEIAFEAGRIIGKFHSLLQSQPVQEYTDTIPNFNYLPFRITEFNDALNLAEKSRMEIAKNEIEFAKATMTLFDEFYSVNLPLRICHNDTKLNNILFSKTNEALCLIDLDTIMKGYFHYDFGDAIRTIVNTASEDEIDLSKINFNKALFEAFIDGLNKNVSFLTNTEKQMLPIAVVLMPFMHGLRALTDFLNGNIYYKESYENQNLNRSASLFQFTKLALQNQSYIKTVISEKL